MKTPGTALEFIPSRGELSIVSAIFNYARNKSPNLNGLSLIDAETAVDILQRSGLSNEELAGIWGIADEDGDGNLSERELAIAVRMIGWAQSGKPVNRSFLTYSDGPLPTIKDIWELNPNMETTAAHFPPVSMHEKMEYERTFRETGPVNGRLDGEKVRDVFIKSNLSYSELDRIWHLIDTHQRGSLNNLEFALGMYLIQAIKTCQLTTIPTSIPSHIYEQLSIPPFATPPSPSLSRTPIPWKTASTSMNPTPGPSSQPRDVWDVSPDEQAEADDHFSALGVEKYGYVDGDVSARYTRKLFRLEAQDIAHIWDLVDLRRDNQLNREQLAVAVHLIRKKSAGVDIPSLDLPPSLIPASMKPKSQPNPNVNTNNVHIRRASAPVSPTTPLYKKSPPPPPPPKRNISQVLKRASSFSPQNSYPGSNSNSNPNSPILSRNSPHRFSVSMMKTLPNTPTIPESSPPLFLSIPNTQTQTRSTTPISTTPSTFNLANSSSVDEENVKELRAETKQLRSQIQELMTQLKSQKTQAQTQAQAQAHIHEQTREETQNSNQNIRLLREENSELKSRLRVLEIALSQAIQESVDTSNNHNTMISELNDEIVKLTNQVSDRDNLEMELRETLSSITELTQERDGLKANNDAVKLEVKGLERKVKEEGEKSEQLQVVVNSLETRLLEMQKIITSPDDGGGSGKNKSKNGGTRLKEFQLLLKEVTRENEGLKIREREMQKSMSTFLLTNGGNHTQVDELKRENSQLKLGMEELEQVLTRMESSSQDNELRRKIQELERERDDARGNVEATRRHMREMEEANERRMEEMQRRFRALSSANTNTRTQNRDEENVPPPAYEEISITIS